MLQFKVNQRQVYIVSYKTIMLQKLTNCILVLPLKYLFPSVISPFSRGGGYLKENLSIAQKEISK